MNIGKRILLLLLAAALLVQPAAALYYEDFPHTDTPFSAMACTGVDVAAAEALADRFAADPAGQYQSLLDLYDEISTQNALAQIDADTHSSDAARAEALTQANDDYYYACDLLCTALGKALRADRSGALHALMTEDQIGMMEDYRPSTEAELEAASAESALITEYSLLPEDKDFPDAAAEIYRKLLALRREEAKREGFDSYPEYAYCDVYLREYTPEDARQLQELVKEKIAPLFLRCSLALSAMRPNWNDDDTPTGEELLSAIAERLPAISPELSESMDFLRRNGLYRIGGGDLADMGYTMPLNSYGSAFLFNRVEGRFDAFRNTVHEFGHFNAFYHDPTPAIYVMDNMDVSEMQSQALELLFLPALQDILAGESKNARAYVALAMLTSMLGSVVDGCMYDEFEQLAYADPDLTVRGLHELEQRLMQEYGLADYFEPEIYWPNISHLFYQPCYYISYAASALPALDVWLLSRRDWDRAVDTYMKISAVRTEEWFLDVLYDNDLCDLTRRGDVLRLTQELESAADELLGTSPAQAALGSPLLWTGVLIGFPLGAAAAALVAVLLGRRKRAKAASASASETAANAPEAP